MKQITVSSYLLILLTALLFVGCQNDDEHLDTLKNESFRLTVSNMEGLETRSSTPTTIGRISYYIANSQGEIFEMPHTGIAPDFSYIRIENLKSGEYRLIVLAESDSRNLISASIRALKTTSDNWLEFTEEQLRPLEKEYYYANHPFRVSNGIISDTEVSLTRIFGKVTVNIRTNSDFAAEGVIRKVEIIPGADAEAYSKIDGNGAYNTTKSFARFDITKTRDFTAPPLPNGASFRGCIAITAITSDGSDAISVYNFSTTIAANALSTVTIDYKHPDDDNVSLYMPFSKYTAANSSRILQDNEPQAVFYNSALRSFNVKTPLQYGFDSDNKLFIRFYSAVGMSDVRLMWRDDTGTNLEFARFDSIPPFFEAHLEHPLSKKGGMIKTEDGRLVRREIIPNLSNAGLNLSIVCNDSYWQKIQAIIPSVNVRFGSYNGNPDAPDGAPSGNWMGIRPVHIREACVLLTNLFYLASSQDFETMVHSYDGEYHTDNGANVSAETLVRQYRSNRSLVAGLIWTGNGVLGLGGGTTWGIWQGAYFNHYNDSYTAWHEMSHCIGYGHSSNLTYGNFAHVYSPRLYTSAANAGKLPVSYPSILNSAKNPNRY